MEDKSNIFLVILLFVFWSIISVWYYVCPIKGFCKAPVITTIQSTPRIPAAAPVVGSTNIQQEEDRTIIYFEFDSNNKITNDDINTYLENLANQLQTNPQPVTIVGHTDDLGNADYNETLGYNRAVMIKDILVANGATNADITTTSKGELEPIATNNTEEGQSLNRRVEIFINS